MATERHRSLPALAHQTSGAAFSLGSRSKLCLGTGGTAAEGVQLPLLAPGACLAGEGGHSFRQILRITVMKVLMINLIHAQFFLIFFLKHIALVLK